MVFLKAASQNVISLSASLTTYHTSVISVILSQLHHFSDQYIFNGHTVYWFTGYTVYWFTGHTVYWFTGHTVYWFTGYIGSTYPHPRPQIESAES